MTRKRQKKPKPPQQFCKCGCGAPTNFDNGKYRTWLLGHHNIKKREIIPCGCGCGNTRLNYNNVGQPRKFINGHQRRGIHYIMSEETKRKISASNIGRHGVSTYGMLGKKHSQETIRKMSEAMIVSWKQRKKKLL